MGWDAPTAVREATAGALQALALMAGFVIFGLGWAMLADASPDRGEILYPSAYPAVCPPAHPLEQDQPESGYAKFAKFAKFATFAEIARSDVASVEGRRAWEEVGGSSGGGSR